MVCPENIFLGPVVQAETLKHGFTFHEDGTSLRSYNVIKQNNAIRKALS